MFTRWDYLLGEENSKWQYTHESFVHVQLFYHGRISNSYIMNLHNKCRISSTENAADVLVPDVFR